MKKIMLLLFGILVFLNCATVNHLLNRTPSKNQKFTEFNSTEFPSRNPTKLAEGMTLLEVKTNFGEPDSVSTGEAGLVIWRYSSAEMYFVDEILINWKEWPVLEMESTQY